jgi:hypothetical protein
MTAHKFTAQDKRDFEAAVNLIKKVSNRIENDAAAMGKLDEVIYPVLDLIDECEVA